MYDAAQRPSVTIAQVRQRHAARAGRHRHLHAARCSTAGPAPRRTSRSPTRCPRRRTSPTSPSSAKLNGVAISPDPVGGETSCRRTSAPLAAGASAAIDLHMLVAASGAPAGITRSRTPRRFRTPARAARVRATPSSVTVTTNPNLDADEDEQPGLRSDRRRAARLPTR